MPVFAAARAERLRYVVALPEVAVQATISLGLVLFVSGEDSEKLLSRADEALYTAKRSGRDQLKLAA